MEAAGGCAFHKWVAAHLSFLMRPKLCFCRSMARHMAEQLSPKACGLSSSISDPDESLLRAPRSSKAKGFELLPGSSGFAALTPLKASHTDVAGRYP